MFFKNSKEVSMNPKWCLLCATCFKLMACASIKTLAWKYNPDKLQIRSRYVSSWSIYLLLKEISVMQLTNGAAAEAGKLTVGREKKTWRRIQFTLNPFFFFFFFFFSPLALFFKQYQADVIGPKTVKIVDSILDEVGLRIADILHENSIAKVEFARKVIFSSFDEMGK